MKSLLLAGTLALSLAGAALANTPPLDYHGHPFPPITHDRACTITHAWEDGPAIATCKKHDWHYDADGQNPPPSVDYDGPRWPAGWYRAGTH